MNVLISIWTGLSTTELKSTRHDHADNNWCRQGYLNDRAEIMQRWADYLDELQQGTKILTLKQPDA
jgi:predicted O-methyltransferase YrrM